MPDAPSPFLNRPLRSIEQAQSDARPLRRWYVQVIDRSEQGFDSISVLARDAVHAAEVAQGEPYVIRVLDVNPTPHDAMVRAPGAKVA